MKLKHNFYIGIPLWDCPELLRAKKQVLKRMVDLIPDHPQELKRSVAKANVRMSLIVITIINNQQLSNVKEELRAVNRLIDLDSEKDPEKFTLKIKGVETRNMEPHVRKREKNKYKKL